MVFEKACGVICKLSGFDFLFIIPLMSIFLRILVERAWAARIKRYGDNGHPCLTPRCKGNQEDMWPLLATVAVISV